jgi:hypothetical protein
MRPCCGWKPCCGWYWLCDNRYCLSYLGQRRSLKDKGGLYDKTYRLLLHEILLRLELRLRETHPYSLPSKYAESINESQTGSWSWQIVTDGGNAPAAEG